MIIQIRIYGIVRVMACNSELIEVAKLYFANEKIRDEVLMRFIADYPDDEFYPFHYDKEVEV